MVTKAPFACAKAGSSLAFQTCWRKVRETLAKVIDALLALRLILFQANLTRAASRRDLMRL